MLDIKDSGDFLNKHVLIRRKDDLNDVEGTLVSIEENGILVAWKNDEGKDQGACYIRKETIADILYDVDEEYDDYK